MPDYLIACQSGAMPQPIQNGLGMSYLVCYKQGGVVDPMIVVEPTYDFQAFIDSLNTIMTFDPQLAAKTVGFCLLMFTIGFAAGVIIRTMRRT